MASVKKKVRELRPQAAPNEKLEMHLARIRQLAGDGENTQVSMMLALLELFEHKEIWSSRYNKWDELLREEGFTTAHRFDGFVKAYNEFGEAEIRKLGIGASALLIRQQKATRVKVHVILTDWINTHKIPPTYQRVTTYVKMVIGDVTGNKAKVASKDEQIVKLKSVNRDLAKKVKSSSDYIERLKKHVWRINGLLKRAKVDPPKMPELVET